MINNVILDVVIGIVFIFLLYSLLATSIQEGISALFALRASTLKKGIIQGMLSDKPVVNNLKTRISVIIRDIKAFFTIVFGNKNLTPSKLGDLFYSHPLIKNYGANRFTNKPSYISSANFSTILIDLLLTDFNSKAIHIAKYKNPDTLLLDNDTVMNNLLGSTDLVKIKELLNYYQSQYLNSGKLGLALGANAPKASETKLNTPMEKNLGSNVLTMDQETCQILLLYLRNSNYNLPDFSLKLESWFNDTMNRVSGWYKRQTQVILFIIGFVIALIFNVDILELSGNLSTDKDARDQLVQLAIKEADNFKSDPHILNKSIKVTDSSEAIFKLYKNNLKQTKKYIDSSIVKANKLVALGWGDYGEKRDSAKTILDFYSKHPQDSLKIKEVNAIQKAIIYHQVLDSLYKNNPIRLKVGYVFHSLSLRKLIAFLLMGFAVCLGAPFWFDILSKVIKLRTTGKKEETPSSNSKSENNSISDKPVVVKINPVPQTDQAVG